MYTQTQACIMHVCLDARVASELLYVNIFKKCVYATDVFISVETSVLKVWSPLIRCQHDVKV